MYLGFDYNFALSRQGELIRWAEAQRKAKQLRSCPPPEGCVLSETSGPEADQDNAWPIKTEESGQRRAS